MSDAWKCDKCGHYFETGKPYEVRSYEGNTRSGACAHKDYDLCDECKKKFDQWIETAPYLGKTYDFTMVYNRYPWVEDELNHLYGNPTKTPEVYLGYMKAFPKASLEDKEYPKKMLEEAAEVYSAWEDWREADAKDDDAELEACRIRLYREICDVLQTCVNMAYAVSKDRGNETNEVNLRGMMSSTEHENKMRGRYDA